MTVHFFALALAASINPSLLGIDLLLIVNRRPQVMLAFVLLGGVGAAVTIGLVDVLVVRSQLVKTEGGIGAGGRLALGLLLIAAGGLLVARRGRRRQQDSGKQGWMQRALSRPRPALAVVVGAVLGLPGALYLAALHDLVTGHWSTATKVIGVIVFALIEFTLVIVPLVLLIVRPQAVEAVLHRAQDWLTRHGRTALACLLLGLGTYLTISSIVSLAG